MMNPNENEPKSDENILLKRIENKDWNAIFVSGECFRLASALHKKYGYPIRGIKSSPEEDNWPHVWVLKDEKKNLALDIRGEFPECVIKFMSLFDKHNEGKIQYENFLNIVKEIDDKEATCIPIDKIIEKIKKNDKYRGYSEKTIEKINSITEKLISNHEMFSFVDLNSNKYKYTYNCFSKALKTDITDD